MFSFFLVLGGVGEVRPHWMEGGTDPKERPGRFPGLWEDGRGGLRRV